jgi:hypothetical protein
MRKTNNFDFNFIFQLKYVDGNKITGTASKKSIIQTGIFFVLLTLIELPHLLVE